VATSVIWGDLTVGADPASGQTITSIEGWENLPGSRYDNIQRARAHGSHPSPVWSDQRLVTVTGTSYSQDQRDALLLELQASMVYGDEADVGEPLTITLAGRTLTATGQLLRCDPTVAAGSWNYGLIGWVAQWRCPDPLRYGPEKTATTGLPTSGGGLVYPLTYPLAYGAASNPGQITLANAGTAAAPIVFDVTGPLPSGFEISAAGAAGSPTRSASPRGRHHRGHRRRHRPRRGHRRPPRRAHQRRLAAHPQGRDGGSVTVQFTSLGGYDPAATLAAAWKDTYW
jgi:hypothetical protein